MRTRWRSDELEFSIMTVTELGEVATMLADRRVCEHLYFGPNTREETLGYFEPLVRRGEAALAVGAAPVDYLFTVRERGRFVGQGAVMPIAFGGGNFLIGYQLRADAWGRRIGTRAAEFLVWFGLGELGARKLSADCLATNTASARILEGRGFVREGLLRRHLEVRGEVRDQALYGLIAAEARVDLRGLRARFYGPSK